MEQEIKVRDDKYTDLDSKFGRLHKRAKQKIQEIQKVRWISVQLVNFNCDVCFVLNLG